MKTVLYLFYTIALLGAFPVLAQDQAVNADPGLAVAKSSDCFTCHRVNQKLIGPSYKDVAAKYKGADEAQIETLANKVIAGGFGNWGNVPMKAHPGLSLDDAKKAVRWVLMQGGEASAAMMPAPNAAPSATPTATAGDSETPIAPVPEPETPEPVTPPTMQNAEPAQTGAMKADAPEPSGGCALLF